MLCHGFFIPLIYCCNKIAVPLYKKEDMYTQKYYPTIVISDVHLGTEHSKTIEVTDFLRTVNCKTLILNGDIIDGGICKRVVKENGRKNTPIFSRSS